VITPDYGQRRGAARILARHAHISPHPAQLRDDRQGALSRACHGPACRHSRGCAGRRRGITVNKSDAGARQYVLRVKSLLS